MTLQEEKGMDETKAGDSMIMDILHDAFPGRSHEQVIPFGLVYAGVRWGRDYRFGDVPEDEEGQRCLVCKSEETYRPYLAWLAAYLLALETEPIYEQKGLCIYVSQMEPEDAVLMMGMNAALYQWDVQHLESAIESGDPFYAYWDHLQAALLDEDDETVQIDEESERELYETVAMELEMKKRVCPDVQHADVGYRLPLSVALKKCQEAEKRVNLLDLFYQAYDNYASK
jgi:hypothetical protein